MEVLDYENGLVMKPLVEALFSQRPPWQMVIYRQPFRWKHFEGNFTDSHIIPNAYEMFDLRQVAEENNWLIIYDFKHAAIVEPKEQV